MLIANDIRMVEFSHDVYFLVNIFLQERFLLDMHFADNFDCVVDVCGFYFITEILYRAKTTYPKAPFPIDLIIS